MSDQAHHSTEEDGSLPLSLFHPLSVLEPEWLRHDHYAFKLSPSSNNSFPGVVLDNCVYVPGSQGQVLKYPLNRRSWTFLKTPEEAVAEYALTEYSNNLVLVSGRSKEYKWSNKIWIRNRSNDQWEDNLVPPVPWLEPTQAPAQYCHSEIVSAVGSCDLLIVLYKMISQDKPRAQPHDVICKCFIAIFRTSEWKSPCQGPPLNRYDKARIINHGNILYAMIYNHTRYQATLFQAQVSGYVIGEWTSLVVAGGAYISPHSSMTILESKLIVTGRSSHNLVLLTPFPDVKGKLSLVDIDELSVDFISVECIIGRPDRSLLVIGEAKKEGEAVAKSSVIRFSQKVTRYDGNQHLTLQAFKKLERGTSIPVLTGSDLSESKLEEIMNHLEFQLHHGSVDVPPAVLYIDSWICACKSNECNTEPTWNNLFDALKHVKLDQLKIDIESCLLKTHAVSTTQPDKKADVSAAKKQPQVETEDKVDDDLDLVPAAKRLKNSNDSEPSTSGQMPHTLLPPLQHDKGHPSPTGASSKPELISRLTERNLPALLKQLKKHTAKWRTIGIHLGFLPGELSNIEARPNLTPDAPISWLGAMLEEWVQWAPGDDRGSTSFANIEELKDALNQSGLGATAHDLKSEYIS